MKTCIILPIKTINKRLPGKTFKDLAGKPLYTYLFDTLKKIGKEHLDCVYVDSSDEEILKEARQWGFETFKRPEAYNSDSTAGDQLISRIIDQLDYSLMGLLHITTPFLSKGTIERAISIMKHTEDIDSLFGVTPHYNRFWYKGKPINHDPSVLLRTQDLIPVQEEADFYFFRKKSFKKYGRRICGNSRSLEVSKIEAVDIDDLEDFLYAETLIKNRLIDL